MNFNFFFTWTDSVEGSICTIKCIYKVILINGGNWDWTNDLIVKRQLMLTVSPRPKLTAITDWPWIALEGTKTSFWTNIYLENKSVIIQYLFQEQKNLFFFFHSWMIIGEWHFDIDNVDNDNSDSKRKESRKSNIIVCLDSGKMHFHSISSSLLTFDCHRGFKNVLWPDLEASAQKAFLFHKR